MPTNGQFCGRSRRNFLWEIGAGFGGVALTSLLDADGFFTNKVNASPIDDDRIFENPLGLKAAHFSPKVKRCIFLFMYGGPSQMDLFDFKPELNKNDGKTAKIEWRNGIFKEMKLLGSKRKFQQHGQSGMWCSDAFPHLSKHMDKLAVIKSLYCDTFAHGSALIQLNSGRVQQGHPCLGSWFGYGLGTLNENLPGFVVMLDPRGGPINGAANWASGYMPAAFQGTVFRSGGQPILNLRPSSGRSRDRVKQEITAIHELNAEHLKSRRDFSELSARIASYQLAYKLQTSAPEALDLSEESQRTIELYGIDDNQGQHKVSVGSGPFGRQCLIARRLAERGVRFIQIYSGGGHSDQNWDAHDDVEKNLKIHCPEIDQPIAGLLTDLEERGLLDETLVVWGGEFGRQAVNQNGKGRDHNPKGFTYWLAGGGVKGGTSYGETNEIGHVATVNRHHIRDLHATILHLMGLDHRKLTYFYGGLDQRLTGVQGGDIIKDVLA